MITFRYDPKALAGDALRAIGGLVLTLGPLIAVDDPLLFVEVILWALAAVFGVYLLRTIDRLKSEIHIDDHGVELAAPGRVKKVSWPALESVKLAHYGSKKGDPASGVMTVAMNGDGTKIVVESSLAEFDTFVGLIGRQCQRPDVAVDASTVHNFDALGMPIGRG